MKLVSILYALLLFGGQREKIIEDCEWKAELPIARKTETDIRWKEKVGRF